VAVAGQHVEHRHPHRDAHFHLLQDRRALRIVGDVAVISTPRFIGPGCMTIASGAAPFSRSRVRP
jgi:hypothetical protein